MGKKLPLMVAGIIFSLVALMHLLRLIYQWEVVIAGFVIPMSVSIFAFIVAGILAIWMFTTVSRN